MEKDLEKCGCNSEESNCGCGEHKHDDPKHECCGGHNHDDDHECCGGHKGDAEHECECGCNDEGEDFVIDLEDENGKMISCPIIDEFEFEEKMYYLAQNPAEDSVYLFRLDEEELVVPDEEEFDRVSAYYQDELVDEKE